MKPYKQIRLTESLLLREFSSSTNSRELVWHRDKNDRTIKILEGNGWHLQMDNGLPIALTPGKEYYIPANTYHRVIKGNSNLRIVISESKNKRIPRKKGQRANSKKHSDLYTDENPKGTIKGLKFATKKDAEASVRKIKKSSRSHNHKTQAAIAMEQRAKVAGKKSAAAVYRKFIEAQKKITANKRKKK